MPSDKFWEGLIKEGIDCTFELSSDGMGPRWQYRSNSKGIPVLTDCGSQKPRVFKVGTVDKVYEDKIAEGFYDDGSGLIVFFNFSMPGHETYQPSQWNLPGFFYFEAARYAMNGCECGAEKCKMTFHAPWCPKFWKY